MADNTATKKKGLFARIKDYVKGVVSELKKVSWPTKKETSKYMIVVIGVCAAFAVLFWVIDVSILSLLKLIV